MLDLNASDSARVIIFVCVLFFELHTAHGPHMHAAAHDDSK